MLVERGCKNSQHIIHVIHNIVPQVLINSDSGSKHMDG